MSYTEFASAPILVLTDQQVKRLLPLSELIEAITHAFHYEYEDYKIPVRVKFVDGSTVVLVMPCQAKGAIGIKTILLASRTGRGPRTYAANYAFHSLNGITSAFFQATIMTELRTAATSAAATRVLASESAETLGVFGTGAIAEAHVEALQLVRNFKQVLVCGSSPEKSRAFAQRLQHRHAIPVRPADVDTCATESSVICTCTTSLSPLFAGKRVKPGTHINAVGAFTPDSRELDSDLMSRARVVVDTFSGALVEAGDYLIPLAEGRISREHVISDLHGALVEPAAARTRPEDITVFKSVGCALEDLVAAQLLLSNARKASTASGSALG